MIAFAQAAGGGIFEFLIMIGLFFAIFYFLLIRPQQKRQKQHQEMLDGLKKNDIVITQGGLVGKVVKLGEDELTIEIAKDVKVAVVRSMIVTKKDK